MKRALAIVALFALGCMPKGGEDYNKGVEAFKAKDYEKARGLFEKAVQANPEFTEAWYNLGASKIRHAKKLAEEGKDKDALAAVRSGIEDKKKAKALMDGGKFVVYKETGEQNRLKKETDDALTQVEKILGEDAATLAWLKLVKFD